MDETSGTSVTDLAGHNNATVSSSSAVSKGRPGIPSGGTSFGFNGSGTLSSVNSLTGPDVFSVEAWFRTSTTKGGKIIGFGSSASGSSSTSDRHIYLTNSGRLRFGVIQSGNRSVGSTATFNDGHWHHVVGTMDATGLKLYADGSPVASRNDVVRGGRYTGYWRVGGDQLSGWTDNPTTGYLTGDIDQAAVYNKAMIASEVSNHRQLGL
jgi:hypothetical protein